jgi:hypothetical protein
MSPTEQRAERSFRATCVQNANRACTSERLKGLPSKREPHATCGRIRPRRPVKPVTDAQWTNDGLGKQAILPDEQAWMDTSALTRAERISA